MTQADAILHDLQKGRRLTPMEALRDYGCLRLAARIDDLKRRGYPVVTRMVEFGGKRYAEYAMAREGELFA